MQSGIIRLLLVDERSCFTILQIIWSLPLWSSSYIKSFIIKLEIDKKYIFTARCDASARSLLSRSVRLSVTFVDHVKTNKHIFEFFSPSGSDTILVFPYQRGCLHSDGNPPNGGVECKGYDKMRIFFTNILLYLTNSYR